jgi:hypothetical protein
MKKILPFKPLKKTRLYEEVADQIKQAIYKGQLEPGERLPSERELCKLFNQKKWAPAVTTLMPISIWPLNSTSSWPWQAKIKYFS